MSLREHLRALLLRPGFRRRALVLGGYSYFFTSSFALFSYLLFPYDQLRDYLIAQAEARYSSGGLELAIGSLSPSWLTGADLTDVHIRTKGEQGEGMNVKINNISARLSLWKRLMGTTAVAFSAEMPPGSIEGKFEQSEQSIHVDVRFDRIALEGFGLLHGALGLPFAGVGEGTVRMHLPAEIKDSEGQIDVQIHKTVLGDGKTKLRLKSLPLMGEGVSLQSMNLGDVHVRARLEKGVLKTERLAATGKDALFAASGTLRLARPFSRSELELMLRLKLTDAYRNRDARTQALLSLVEVGLAPARTTDGYIQYRLSGAFGYPRATPAGRAPFP